MKTYNLVFTEEELKYLEMGLMEIPTKYGAPMIAKIGAQIQKLFDKNSDEKDMPTGQTTQPDQCAGD